MIKGFENETQPLKPEEKEIILPMLLEGFRTKRKANPIKAPVIVRMMKGALIAKGYKGVAFSEVRLRKLCNYIRSNGMLPLVADGSGYYCAVTKEEVQSQVDSLNERAAAIKNSADGLQKFINDPSLLAKC